VEPAVALGEPAGLLDEQVDRLGAAVAQAAGVEVGKDVSAPGGQGTTEPGDLGDGAGRQAGDDLLECPAGVAAGSQHRQARLRQCTRTRRSRTARRTAAARGGRAGPRRRRGSGSPPGPGRAPPRGEAHRWSPAGRPGLAPPATPNITATLGQPSLRSMSSRPSRPLCLVATDHGSLDPASGQPGLPARHHVSTLDSGEQIALPCRGSSCATCLPHPWSSRSERISHPAVRQACGASPDHASPTRHGACRGQSRRWPPPPTPRCHRSRPG
jgi:hypothetical protein